MKDQVEKTKGEGPPLSIGEMDLLDISMGNPSLAISREETTKTTETVRTDLNNNELSQIIQMEPLNVGEKSIVELRKPPKSKYLNDDIIYDDPKCNFEYMLPVSTIKENINDYSRSDLIRVFRNGIFNGKI
jgi:hypothetical protein